MTQFLFFLLSTIGMSNIIVHGKILDVLNIRSKTKQLFDWLVVRGYISEKRRDLMAEGARCYECTGFWCGLFLSIALLSFKPWVFIPAAFAGSTASFFFSELIFYLRNSVNLDLTE